MRIDEADAVAEQPMQLNEPNQLIVGDRIGHGQIEQQADQDGALPQAAEGDLANHKGMSEDETVFEKALERRLLFAEMIDPDRAIDKDHCIAGRRRGAGSRPGSVPPRRARRRALSRSIKACKA